MGSIIAFWVFALVVKLTASLPYYENTQAGVGGAQAQSGPTWGASPWQHSSTGNLQPSQGNTYQNFGQRPYPTVYNYGENKNRVQPQSSVVYPTGPNFAQTQASAPAQANSWNTGYTRPQMLQRGNPTPLQQNAPQTQYSRNQPTIRIPGQYGNNVRIEHLRPAEFARRQYLYPHGFQFPNPVNGAQATATASTGGPFPFTPGSPVAPAPAARALPTAPTSLVARRPPTASALVATPPPRGAPVPLSASAPPGAPVPPGPPPAATTAPAAIITSVTPTITIAPTTPAAPTQAVATAMTGPPPASPTTSVPAGTPPLPGVTTPPPPGAPTPSAKPVPPAPLPLPGSVPPPDSTIDAIIKVNEALVIATQANIAAEQAQQQALVLADQLAHDIAYNNAVKAAAAITTPAPTTPPPTTPAATTNAAPAATTPTAPTTPAANEPNPALLVNLDAALKDAQNKIAQANAANDAAQKALDDLAVLINASAETPEPTTPEPTTPAPTTPAPTTPAPTTPALTTPAPTTPAPTTPAPASPALEAPSPPTQPVVVPEDGGDVPPQEVTFQEPDDHPPPPPSEGPPPSPF